MHHGGTRIVVCTPGHAPANPPCPASPAWGRRFGWGRRSALEAMIRFVRRKAAFRDSPPSLALVFHAATRKCLIGDLQQKVSAMPASGEQHRRANCTPRRASAGRYCKKCHISASIKSGSRITCRPQPFITDTHEVRSRQSYAGLKAETIVNQRTQSEQPSSRAAAQDCGWTEEWRKSWTANCSSSRAQSAPVGGTSRI